MDCDASRARGGGRPHWRFALVRRRCAEVLDTFDALVEQGVLRETTGQKRNRLHRFDELVVRRDQEAVLKEMRAAELEMKGSVG